MTVGWQNPGALWALTLVALPVVIHLLRTHHARRVAFPSLRFVQTSRSAAVRMRLPSDVLLMMVRMAIVACAVVALARPIVLTEARTSAWDHRIARAVVVDTSESMRASNGSAAAPAGAAAEAAAAELRTAAYGARFDAPNLQDGIARASRWLTVSPPARREIVVISDLQKGAIRASAGGAVADGIGLRFVGVGRNENRGSFEGAPLFGTGDVPPGTQRIETTLESTAVVIDAQPGLGVNGLRVIAASGSESSVARLLRTVAIAGAPAGSSDQPIAVQLSGASPGASPSLAPIRSAWMFRTILRLRDHPLLATSGQAASGTSNASQEQGWVPVTRGADGATRVRAAALGRELFIDVAASADDLFAAAVVQAVLAARIEPAGYDEHEIARLDERATAALTRPAASVTRDAWRTAEATDARWCWLASLLLLAAEQWMRARRVEAGSVEVSRAAA